MLNRVMTIALAVAVLAVTGCAELKTLRAENKDLKSQLASLQAERDGLVEEKNSLIAEVADMDDLKAKLAASEDREAKARDLETQLRGEQQKLQDQAAQLKQLIKDLGPGWGVKQGAEGNFIVMESGILFESGKAELTEQAQQSLGKVADYLLANPDVPIRIDGHTDGQPIRHSGWQNNYHLGAMRALAVMTFLTDRGVDPERMYITSFGPNKPVVPPPDPEAAVPENRRVEIMLVPTGMRSYEDILKQFAD